MVWRCAFRPGAFLLRTLGEGADTPWPNPSAKERFYRLPVGRLGQERPVATGSRIRRKAVHEPSDGSNGRAARFLIVLDGGYFGRGIGFPMLAALATSRIPVRAASSL